MNRVGALPAIALLAACATGESPMMGGGPPGSAGSLASARLGERVEVDGPQVTPLAVLEDSRCPAEGTCVWAGRVRIRARIHLGSGDVTREMTLAEPIQLADGALELAAVRPARSIAGNIEPGDYRFAFSFAGGF